MALSSFYQCGDLYRIDSRAPGHAGQGGLARVPEEPGSLGASCCRRRDRQPLFFNYGKQAPYMHYVVDAKANRLVHYVDVELPGPRLPHDMAFTENYVDPQRLSAVQTLLLAQGIHPALPAQGLRRRAFAVPPRRRGRRPLVRSRYHLMSCTSPTRSRTATIKVDGVLPGQGGPRARPDQMCRPGCTAGGSTRSPVRPAKSKCRTASPNSA